MKPLVSVILPVYNVQKYLEVCVNSIIRQTYPVLEVVAVNDGSTDKSLEILERMAKSDKRIRIISQENKGLSAARNKGLEEARGDYIQFVDSDDFVSPLLLERTLEVALKNDSDISLFNLKLFFSKINKCGFFRDELFFLRNDERVTNFKESPRLGEIIGAWDRLFKADFLASKGIRFVNGLIYEDVPFTIETITQTERISIIKEHLYYYRKNVSSSITGQEANNKKFRENFLKARMIAKVILDRTDLDYWDLRFYYRLLLEQAQMHYMNINNKKERACFLKSLAELTQQLPSNFLDWDELSNKEFVKNIIRV